MKISKVDLINNIMILQIGWILFFGIVYSYYPQMAILSYVPDLLNVILTICILERMRYGIKREYLILAVFIAYVGISVFWGDLNWYYIISSFRRYVTAFLIYYATSEYITEKYLKKGVNLLLFALGIDVLITGYQNLVLKLHPDFCNGIFGFKTYDNAMQGMFCLIISIIAMVYYIDKKWTKKKTIYAIGASCLICAFAEIKAYYVLLLIVFFIVFLLRCNNRKLRKKIFGFIVIGSLLLIIAYKVLEIIFPANLSTFFNLNQYILYERYGARGGAGRLTSISYIYKQVFKSDILQTFIGKGLGEISNEFAYTIGKLFVSCGSIGLLLFAWWVVGLAVRRLKTVKFNSESLISISLLIMIVVTLFVWNALFTQVVFLIFWILGIYNARQYSN